MFSKVVQTGRGGRGSFSVVKRPGRDIEHSPPSRAKVMPSWHGQENL
jgi:hypothetical protein